MSEMEDKENFEVEQDSAPETEETVDIEIEDGEAEDAPTAETESGQESAGDEDSEEAEESEEAAKAEASENSEEEAQEACEDKEADGAKEKGGLFKKKKDKKDKKDEKIRELTDQLKRQMAEFENFRKRSEKEKSQMFDMGAKTVVEKMLTVVDNFERGLEAVPEEQKEDPFVSGMDMIYKQIMTEFDNLGVKPIECVGKEFDPEFHNAVMQVESEEYDSGIVAQELQKGYTYKDSVVRHSMVAVVQ